MTKITIEKSDQWMYNFYTDKNDGEIWGSPDKFCNYCGMDVNTVYSYIINCLKEAKLLPEDYKLICCYCDTLKEYGLLELESGLNQIFYIKKNDVLSITFRFRDNDNDEEIVYFNIHDFAKIRGKRYG